MINRQEYLDKLISLKDKQIIKIVTGIRRCGKSTLLDLFAEYLLSCGINANQILRINFEEAEDEAYKDLLDHRQLYRYIKERLVDGKMNYIILDEIQHVKDFQKAVDALFVKKNVDLYITGSNSYLLSGELATLLSGRYMEIQMQPFSLKEYKEAFPDLSKTDLFQKYLTDGSFPFALQLQGNYRNVLSYLDALYNTIIVKDIADRKGLMDTSALKRIAGFMSDNIGNLISIKKIADTMTSDGQNISPHTVDVYISSLKNCFFLYSVPRYDIKGKEYLKSGEKYYVADIALRNSIIGQKNQDYGHILENIVYLELIRRGYRVFVGKVGEYEIDFTALKGSDINHYQVAWTAIEENTLKRELRPLELIGDHNPKYLLTMDPIPVTSHNGIKQINVLDWLLS
ncbi:MAG: ATP-binding protein [Alphaproteobacteria bacterium]|nr:ATP-binding protein [Alphaproteobacteria bacterium]